jgi:hypothetical protein
VYASAFVRRCGTTRIKAYVFVCLLGRGRSLPGPASALFCCGPVPSELFEIPSRPCHSDKPCTIIILIIRAPPTSATRMTLERWVLLLRTLQLPACHRRSQGAPLVGVPDPSTLTPPRGLRRGQMDVDKWHHFAGYACGLGRTAGRVCVVAFTMHVVSSSISALTASPSPQSHGAAVHGLARLGLLLGGLHARHECIHMHDGQARHVWTHRHSHTSRSVHAILHFEVCSC